MTDASPPPGPRRRPPRLDGDTLAAELALGVLDAGERAAAEARAAADPAFAAEAAEWSDRLHPLAESARPVEPSPDLWARIDAALAASEAAAAPPPVAAGARRGAAPAPAARRRPTRWRRMAIAAGVALSVVSAGAVGLFAGRRTANPPLLAARLDPPAGGAVLSNDTLFTATLDRARASVLVTPVNPGPVDPRVRELWLIPAGGKPQAVGAVNLTRTAPLHLSRALAAAARAGATLAVSLEPRPSQADGAPTGPVIAAGVLAHI